MSTEPDTMTRIDARIPLYVRESIDKAAAMLGRTRTEFLISAALEKAEKTISEHALIRLSQRDQVALAAALKSTTTQPPNERMQKLVEEYSERVERR
jgi:uncharacterized protein (DUF1778 family)